MATSKQTRAANVQKARRSAASKKTFSHMPSKTRTALGKQGAAAARRKRTGGASPKTRAELYEIARQRDLPGRVRHYWPVLLDTWLDCGQLALANGVIPAGQGAHMPSKAANVKNEKQYEKLKDKGMSKSRAARIANSPSASNRGGKKSGSGSSP